MNSRKAFTLIELLVVVVILGLLMALLMPALQRALCTGRAGTAKALIEQLGQAASAYNLDYGIYPAETNNDVSAELAKALNAQKNSTTPYFEFRKDMLNSDGSIRNPVNPAGAPGKTTTVYYHAPGVKNKSTFDMWCSGCDKKDTSINNYGE